MTLLHNRKCTRGTPPTSYSHRWMLQREYEWCLHYSVAAPHAVNGCILESKKDAPQPLIGYLAARSSGRRHGSRACGTDRSPWLVTVRRGQRIRFTLMDFSSTADSADDDVQLEKRSHQVDNSGQFNVLALNPLTPTVYIWVQLQSRPCQTELSRRL